MIWVSFIESIFLRFSCDRKSAKFKGLRLFNATWCAHCIYECSRENEYTKKKKWNVFFIFAADDNWTASNVSEKEKKDPNQNLPMHWIWMEVLESDRKMLLLFVRINK